MISSGTFISGRHWNVQLKNGILIKLPEDNPEKAWAYLTKKQKDSKILESNIKTIDLRIEQKMFVK
jgi:cell division protein FtsQ